MTDEEYFKLRETLDNEERKRWKISQLQKDIDEWKKYKGLKKPDGFTGSMDLTITESALCSGRCDGNGDYYRYREQIKMSGHDTELFFEAIDIMVERKTEELKKRIEELDNDNERND